MNERQKLTVNVVVAAVSVIGASICAIQFAMAVRFLQVGRCVLYFFLASLCIETSVFSIANLLKKIKQQILLLTKTVVFVRIHTTSKNAWMGRSKQPNHFQRTVGWCETERIVAEIPPGAACLKSQQGRTGSPETARSVVGGCEGCIVRCI